MGSARRLTRRPVWHPIPRLTPGACMGRVIQARSVSDGIGTTFDATPGVASDPPAYAGGLYGSVSDCVPCPRTFQAVAARRRRSATARHGSESGGASMMITSRLRRSTACRMA